MVLQSRAKPKPSAPKCEPFGASGLGVTANHEITMSSPEEDMYWEICFPQIQGIFLLLYKPLVRSPITGKDRTIVFYKILLKAMMFICRKAKLSSVEHWRVNTVGKEEGKRIV